MYIHWYIYAYAYVYVNIYIYIYMYTDRDTSGSMMAPNSVFSTPASNLSKPASPNSSVSHRNRFRVYLLVTLPLSLSHSHFHSLPPLFPPSLPPSQPPSLPTSHTAAPEHTLPAPQRGLTEPVASRSQAAARAICLSKLGHLFDSVTAITLTHQTKRTKHALNARHRAAACNASIMRGSPRVTPHFPCTCHTTDF